MKKLFFLITILYCFSFADDKKSVAKILVVDKQSYEKIETVNILKGGIDKKFVINSSRLSTDNMKKFYPEYFLYSGQRCQLINKIEVINKEYKNTHDVTAISNSATMKKEIEKLKLLQALVDIGYKNNNTYDLNRDSIKAFGILCDGKLMIRQKFYEQNNFIGKYKIRKINTTDNSLYLEVR